MTNSNIVPFQHSQQPAVGQHQDGWTWDGNRWVCEPDCGDRFPPFCNFPPVVSPPLGQPPWYPGANGGVSFSQNPPPNPVRGHFWWNGTVLQMFDGAAWVTIGGPGSAGGGGGASTGPSPPPNPSVGQLFWNGSQLLIWDGNGWVVVSTGVSAQTSLVFSVLNPTPGTVAASTWVVAPISGIPNINTVGNWDVSTKIYKPTKAGIYAFELQAWSPVSGGRYALALLRNDPGVVGPSLLQGMEVILITESPNPEWLSAVGLANMNGTTDFVRLWINSSSGTFDQSYGFPTLRAYLLP